MKTAPLLLLAAAACSGNEHLAIDARCNPLGFAGHCAVPVPSSAYEVGDPTTATGRRIAIPPGALPTNSDGVAIDPSGWNLADGWSPSAPIMVAFPSGVSPVGLVPFDDMTASTTPQSPTILVDMTTGELVAHFAEVDVGAVGSLAPPQPPPGSLALFVRPAQRLVGGHRYAVAITKGVTAADGKPLPVPPGFTALLDTKKKTDHPLLEAMRPRFGDVLSALVTAGVAQDQLVVAWDFTVASDDFLHREMIAARDRTVAALANHPIGYTIKSDGPDSNPSSGIARYLTGTLDAPLFLNTPEFGVSHTTIVRDADGLPAVQGFYQIPFAAVVPQCAYTSATPVPMIMYGHGLLGDATEVDCCGANTYATDLCMIVVGTDMRGMSQNDTAAVATALNDLSYADEVFGVLEQGIANHVTLARAMETTFAQTLFVDPANGNKQLADPTKVFYDGNSQGGIFGGSVMAYEPTITRGVLGVPAAGYALMLDRSSDWPSNGFILWNAYPDRLDTELGIALCQMRWDKTEPAGIANSMLSGTATGVPPKQVLMQAALGDEQVSNLGTYWEARSMGIPVVTPSVATPWGLTTADAPTAGQSALVLYSGGAPPIPTTDTPPVRCGEVPLSVCPSPLNMHELPRSTPAAIRQVKQFYLTGQIVNECTGACACTVDSNKNVGGPCL